MNNIIHFLKYHNGVPIVLGVIFLGSGAALAANPEVREGIADTIIISEQKVKSVDNSFIVGADLDSFMPTAQITDVTEDEENYYVIYTLNTIDLEDGRWGTISRQKELVASKALLGNEDLGVYVAEEIKEVVDHQVTYLKEVQIKERKKGQTQKVVATTYSGLIGKYLDSKEEVIVGYEPVVKRDQSEIISQESSDASQQSSVISHQPDSQMQSEQKISAVAVTSGEMSVSTGSGATMVMVGNNPAKVPTSALGTGYSDNGVRARESEGQDISVKVTVDGMLMREVAIDTRVSGMHIIQYTAVDRAGNTMTLERAVLIYDRYKTVAPAIVILGDTFATAALEEPYTDAGAIAIDYDDGDISGKITVENTVNTVAAGTYKVLYNATDSDGNTSTAARVVTVVE